MTIYIYIFLISYVLMLGSIFVSRNKDGLFYRMISYESHCKLLMLNALILPSLLAVYHTIKLFTDEDYMRSYSNRIGRII
jgi:hypothetical protein